MKTLVVSAVLLLSMAQMGHCCLCDRNDSVLTGFTGNNRSSLLRYQVYEYHGGYSTLCYTCTMSLTDQSCLKVANCTGTTPYCGTSRINGFVMTYISKFCSAACVNANQNFTVLSATESCCSSDLCNTEQIGDVNSAFLGSGSGGLSGSALLLVTIGGLLSAIFTM